MIIVGLLGALAGCGAVVNGAQGGTPGNGAGVTMGGSPSTSRPSAQNGEVTVTEADSGKTVHLHIGQRLRVMLGGHGELWHRPTTPGPSLRVATADGGYPSSRPASAVFVAVQAGAPPGPSLTHPPRLPPHPPAQNFHPGWAGHVYVTGTR